MSDRAPAPDRGPLIGVGDIIERMTVKRADGSVKGPSAWTVTQTVCPEGKMSIGGECYWYEAEFLAWLAARRGYRRRGKPEQNQAA